jgi:vitamin B12 transporter
VEQDYTENSTIAVTYFEQVYDDLIQWEQVAPGTWQPVNIAEANVKGIEAEAGYRLMDELLLNVAYTYLDTEDKSTGDRLSRRPVDKLKLAADYATGGLSLHADYIHVGKRLDTPGGRNLSAYNVVNISGSYILGKHVTLSGRVENLFDEDYEEAGGFSTPGATVYGGIKVVL